MPQSSPVAGKGSRFQDIKTTATACDPVEPGDICVFVKGFPAERSADVHIKKVATPTHLNRRYCLVLERGIVGQDVKVLVSGHADCALSFDRPIDWDDPLVLTMAGTLTNDAKKGDRIVAYARCEIPKRDGPRPMGRVFFDGVTGFGNFQ